MSFLLFFGSIVFAETYVRMLCKLSIFPFGRFSKGFFTDSNIIVCETISEAHVSFMRQFP